MFQEIVHVYNLQEYNQGVNASLAISKDYSKDVSVFLRHSKNSCFIYFDSCIKIKTFFYVFRCLCHHGS